VCLHSGRNFIIIQHNVSLCIFRWAHTTYADAVYCSRPSSVVCRSVALVHTSGPCRNVWSNQDAIWVEDSDGPMKPCIRWGSISPDGKGQFWGGKGWPIVKYTDTLRSPVQKQPNRLWCHLDCGLSGPSGHRPGLRSEKTMNYCLHRLRTKFGERAFSYSGPAAWNRLPHDARGSPSLNVFIQWMKKGWGEVTGRGQCFVSRPCFDTVSWVTRRTPLTTV